MKSAFFDLGLSLLDIACGFGHPIPDLDDVFHKIRANFTDKPSILIKSSVEFQRRPHWHIPILKDNISLVDTRIPYQEMQYCQ